MLGHVVFVTGIPATGKTEVAARLKTQLIQAGIPTHFANDYPVLELWAKDNRGDTDKVRWESTGNGGEFFSIVPQAYPEASSFVAESLARETLAILGTFGAVIVESARGAGIEGRRDRYDDNLFAPFVHVLGEVAHFANVEVTVKDPAIALERARIRLQRDSTAAPPFVVEKYISLQDGIQSATEQARSFGSLFTLNIKLDNSRDTGSMHRHLDGVISQLVEFSTHQRDRR